MDQHSGYTLWVETAATHYGSKQRLYTVGRQSDYTLRVDRPGAEVLGSRVLEYIFEILVLVEIMVNYSYSNSYLCSMHSDFTSTSEYFLI